jgi:hypothetical protein
MMSLDAEGFADLGRRRRNHRLDQMQAGTERPVHVLWAYLYHAAHCINSNKHRNVEITAKAVAIPRPVSTRHKVQDTAATAKAIVSQTLVALASSGTRAMMMHARSESPITIASAFLPPTFISDVSIRFENSKRHSVVGQLD